MLSTDPSKTVHMVPMADIFFDTDFNCRADVTPFSVRDLAANIKQNGLLSPIVLQPYDKSFPFKYRIIAGHRRFQAYRQNQESSIPAFIRGDLSDRTAAILNITENIQRSELSLMEEALALQKLRNSGMSEVDIRNELKVSYGWVQVRSTLLQLPPPIQQLVAKGLINQEQIKDLHQYRGDPEKQMMIASAIKDAKLRGDRTNYKINKKSIKEKQEKSKNEVKVRTRGEIFKVQDVIHDAMQGGCLATRVAAWCAGIITTSDLMEDVKKEAELDGRNWQIPLEYRTDIKV